MRLAVRPRGAGAGGALAGQLGGLARGGQGLAGAELCAVEPLVVQQLAQRMEQREAGVAAGEGGAARRCRRCTRRCPAFALGRRPLFAQQLPQLGFTKQCRMLHEQRYARRCKHAVRPAWFDAGGGAPFTPL